MFNWMIWVVREDGILDAHQSSHQTAVVDCELFYSREVVRNDSWMDVVGFTDVSSVMTRNYLLEDRMLLSYLTTTNTSPKLLIDMTCKS